MLLMQVNYFGIMFLVISLRKGKPVKPINPLKNPLKPIDVHPALDRRGIARDGVPHNPNYRPS
jgi:hypothetical protein